MHWFDTQHPVAGFCISSLAMFLSLGMIVWCNYRDGYRVRHDTWTSSSFTMLLICSLLFMLTMLGQIGASDADTHRTDSVMQEGGGQ
jgi:hypothetical protein